jgi:hypothetical protein
MENLLFFHGKTTDGHRFTIAGKFNDEQFLTLGAAICSGRDPFVKKVGRYKASGRIATHGNKGHKVVALPARLEQQIKGFLDYVSNFNNVSSKELLKQFNLYHQ